MIDFFTLRIYTTGSQLVFAYILHDHSITKLYNNFHDDMITVEQNYNR